MSKLGNLSEKKGLIDALWYKVLSALSGKDLKQTEREKLRRNRKRIIEMSSGRESTPAPRRKEELQAIVAAGLNEAKLMDNFDPDLLIMTKKQYKMYFDIPAAIGMGETQVTPTHDRYYSHKPPQIANVDDFTIDVTYSEAADGMLLVESDSL